MTLLPQPPKSGDYKHAPINKGNVFFFLDRGQNLKAITLGRGGSVSALCLWNLPDPPL